MATRKAYIFGLQDDVTLAIVKDGNGNPILYQSPRDYVPGSVEPSYEEVIAWDRYYGAVDTIMQNCGVTWQPISIGQGPNLPPTFTFGQFKIERLISTGPAAQWRGSMDFIDCNEIRFWAVNLTDPGKPTTMRLFQDGVYIASATVNHARQDVVNSFATQSITLPTNLLGGRISLPESVRDNQPHTYRLFFENTSTEITTYYVSNQITCAPATAPDQVKGNRLDVSNPVVEGGVVKARAKAIEILTNNVERIRTAPTLFDFSQAIINGCTMTVISNGEIEISLAANTIDSDQVRELTIKETSGLTVLAKANVTFINAACERPGNLTRVGLSYRVKYPNNSVQAYSTLEEANRLAGRIYDGTLAGELEVFAAHVTSLEVGADVYAGDGNDCGKASDNIYYVTGASGGNPYKMAILVHDGKIVQILYSSYTTNTPPIVGKIPDQTITQGQSLLYVYDQNLFTDPGDTLTVTPVTLPNGVVFNANERKFSGGANLGVAAYPVKIKATDSVGQAVEAPFTLNVVPPTQPYIEKIAIYYPEFWRYVNRGSYTEGVGIFVSVAGPNAANAVVNFRYTQSTLYAANADTRMEKTVAAAANGNIPPMPQGYNRVSSIFWDEVPIWSAITRQLTISITNVANSAVTVPIKAVVGSVDLSFTQIYPQ